MSAVPILEINNLSVSFRTRSGIVDALRGIGFTVNKGEIVGVVGESGSGKSVTAYSVLELLGDAGSKTSGSIRFDGMDITHPSNRTMRDIRGREISMIFQNPHSALNPIRPVGKHIEDVLHAHAIKTGQDATKSAIELLKKVKIKEAERRYWAYPFELSGGMCQRVMIAIALACDPRLLIADEPTTGLDVTTQKATMDLVAALVRSEHRSCMIITHDLALASQYCDRIVVMQSGKIVETGNVPGLFENPQHEYTQKLIAASPRADTKAETFFKTATPVKREPEPAQAQKYILEVIDLVKAYPVQQQESWLTRFKARRAGEAIKPTMFLAVDKISFTIRPGESLGLVGESGSGKSTTSNLIARLTDPTEGAIIFNGKDITGISADKMRHTPMRSEIQMVFQDPYGSLNPRWTVRNIIADPMRWLLGQTDETTLNSRVDTLAEQVGLPAHLLTRLPHQLSGGQKARVGIARAISVNPKLLILDEPTSALDVSVQAVVLKLLNELRYELGMSYLFVSHDLHVVKLMCDSVIVMNQGKIVESGKPDKILEHPEHPYTQSLVQAIPNL